MPKRGSRPWERRGIGRDDFIDDASPSKAPVPHITVDGLNYLSDRFYLHHPAALDDTTKTNTGACHCGAKSPPPLLHRGRLVAALDLRAAIVATYTLDPTWMVQEFPSLFDGSVPTLVLHGQKGFAGASLSSQTGADAIVSEEKVPCASLVAKQNEIAKPTFTKSSSFPDETKSLGLEREVICIDDSSDEEERFLKPAASQKPAPVRVTSREMTEKVDTTIVQDVVSNPEVKTKQVEEPPPEEGWLSLGLHQSPSQLSYGNTVHFTQVLTTWLPPCASGALSAGPLNRLVVERKDVLPQIGVDADILNRRKPKRGVHHPKYMILFEKRGSVVVLVSTGNLTKPMSCDGSWMQRFEPAPSNRDPPKVSNKTRCDGSDFGYVLANFLQCQSQAAREGQMLPQDFLKKYLDIASLDSFRRRYRFEDSQVHLIATVPGDYPGRHSSMHLGKKGKSRSFLYGPQRVADIVARVGSSSDNSTGEKATVSESKSQPWLPDSILSDQDRLIMQTTSFGGNWKRENFAELVRSYCGYDDLKQVKASNARKDDELVERTDILWPTKEFMDGLSQSKQHERKSPDSVLGVAESGSNESPSFIFLSSMSFNTIEIPCLSRMVMYEPSIPQQMPCVLPPHIKTFGRMFEGNEYNLRQRYGASKAEECFSWLMLTSACLSLGAQGKAVPDRGFESDEMTYSNFELGVLFCSRLQGKNSDRLYCWKPTQCVCAKNKKGASMIHLPIPYCLRPSTYQDDPDEADMCATPYFHEVPDGTGFVGQMTLTPLGAALAASRL